jgi:subtilisin family serine protease
LSYGGSQPSDLEQAAIAAAPEVLFVAAAGNDGTDNDLQPTYPCSYDLPNIVCVAATNQNDALADFSNDGPTHVDLAAPGVGTLGAATKMETVFTDGFESPPLVNWDLTLGSWGLATPTAASGAMSLTDSPGCPYAPYSSNRARLTSASFAGRQGCHAAYQLRLDSESGVDGLRVESSINGFQTATEDDTFSGSTAGQFVPLATDLTHRDGQSSVELQLRFTSNGSNPNNATFDGAYIDDFAYRCFATTPYTGADDEFHALSGTSFAAPHVSGTAALILSRVPSLSALEVKSRILETVDPLPSLQGRVVTGGRLDAGRALGTTADTSPADTSPAVPAQAEATPASVVVPPPPPLPVVTIARSQVSRGPCAGLRGAKKTLCLAKQKALAKCARLGGRKKAVCRKRALALVKCSTLKPGPAKTRCLVKARRIE